jgi:outer membrane lipoprotein SlyB
MNVTPASRKIDIFIFCQGFVIRLVGLSLLAGCAVTTGPAISAPAALGTHTSIVAVRPVPALVGDGMAARVLGSASHPVNLAEFIVRTDDGRTLSVVQPADAALKPGTSALLTAGARPRLTPAKSNTAASI